MFYILASVIFVLFQSLMIILSKINIVPEFFIYPWFIGKGIFIYRDFFINHDFLLYYLFSVFPYNINLYPQKIFYILIQATNLLLVLYILRKNSSKLFFLFFGLLYLLLNYYFSENILWDEVAITTLYLLTYIIYHSKNRYKNIILSLVISLASFIKPTAIVIILPVLFVYRNLSAILTTIILWGTVLIYFFYNKAFPQFIDNLFKFNSFYTSYYLKNYHFLSEFLIPAHILATIFILIFILIFIQAKAWKKDLSLFPFLLASAFFLFPVVGRVHFLPLIAFLIIYIASLMKSAVKQYILILLTIYMIFLCFTVKNIFFIRRNTPTFIDSDFSKKIITFLKANSLSRNKIYILSNHVEIYYKLNNPFITYYPIIFPSVSEYYHSRIQKEIINSLTTNKTTVVIFPIPLDENFSNLTVLSGYIKKQFILKYTQPDFQIYVKN